MSRKVVGVVEMEDLQRLFCIREKLNFIALMKDDMLNCDSCRRNLRIIYCYSHGLQM